MPVVHRYLEEQTASDLADTMVFLCGPRQCGKTTMAKSLCERLGASIGDRYLNYDVPTHRALIQAEQLPSGPGLLVLDEIHKMKRWRQVVKGLYDGRGEEVQVLITGSARLDHYRRGGDSLQGRYHLLRLLPFTYAELGAPGQSTVADLLRLGGFPKPFLSGSDVQARRWSREYRTRLIREDMRDLERVVEIDTIELLAARLPQLVGAPLSLNALREDLQVSFGSVKRWVAALERLYMLFRLAPFGAPRIRAVKKEAKHYLFDWTLVEEPGPRFENMVACHLLKWCWYQQDTLGRDIELRYFRDIDRREVDFVVVEGTVPKMFVECKMRSGREVSPGLRYLVQRFPKVEAFQVSFDEGPDVTNNDGIRLCPAGAFLSSLL